MYGIFRTYAFEWGGVYTKDNFG